MTVRRRPTRRACAGRVDAARRPRSARARRRPTRGSARVLVTADGAALRGRHRAAGRPPRRGRRPRRAPAPAAPRAPPLVRHPRAVLAPRPHPAVRRRRRRRRRRPGRRRHRATPTRRSPAGASPACGPPASRSSVGVRRRRGRRRSSRRTSTTAAPAGPTSCSSWPPPSTAAPPRPTAPASGSPAPEARADAHRLRAESDAVLVGAGTVRADDPELTVRHVDGPATRCRVVLGHAPAERQGPPLPSSSTATSATCSTSSAAEGVLQVLVEGGATVAGAFHRAGLVDRYVALPGPALFGGDDARRLFAGPGAADDRRRVARPHRRGRPGSATTSASTSHRGDGSDLMFTGIVEELGTVAARDGRPAPHRRHARARGRRRSATRSPSTAAASPSSTSGDGLVGGRRQSTRPYARTNLGDLAARRPGQPRAARPPGRPPRRPPRAGPRRRASARSSTRRPTCGSRMPADLLRYVVEKGSITVDGVSLTVVDVARRRLHRRRHPAHRRGHHPRAARARATA